MSLDWEVFRSLLPPSVGKYVFHLQGQQDSKEGDSHFWSSVTYGAPYEEFYGQYFGFDLGISYPFFLTMKEQREVDHLAPSHTAS